MARSSKLALESLLKDKEREEKRRKENHVNQKTYTGSPTNSSTSGTVTNNSKSPAKKERSSRLALESLLKEEGKSVETVRKNPTVAFPPATVGKSPTTKTITLEDINSELLDLTMEFNAKEKKYTNAYWDSRLNSEMERFYKQGAESSPNGIPQTSIATEAFMIVDGEKKAWDTERADLRKKIMDLTSMKKVYESMSVLSAPDYKEFSEKGASIENPTWKEAAGVIFGIGAEEIKNPVTYSRENPADTKSNKRYLRMTDEEVGAYNYLLAKHGNEKAQEFLDSLDLILETRQGKVYAESLDDIEIPVVEQLATVAHGLYAGAEGRIRGIGENFSDKPHRTTATEVASGYIKEKLKDEGIKIGDKSSAYYLYGGAETVGNMLPSIAVSYLTKGLGSAAGLSAGTAATVGQIAGTATMGLSASGSAYAQALAEGYDAGQARAYGALVGASESMLQYLLGGIKSLGGASSNKLMTKLAAVDKAYLRVAGTAGIKIGSEIAEEELQLFIEPYLRTAIFNEEYDAPEIEEMVETALITAISTGVLEGGSISKAGKGKSSYGQDLIDEVDENGYKVGLNNTIEAGLEAPIGSAAREIAEKLNADRQNGREISAHKLGVLADEIVEEGKRNTQPATLEEAAQAVVNDRESDRMGEISEETKEMGNLFAETEEVENKSIVKPRNVIGEVTDNTKSLLGDGNRTVGFVDGQAYVTNSEDILPSPTNRSVFLSVNNAESAKAELGATESNKTSANIGKILTQSDFTPIRGGFVDGTLENVGDVRVFTDEEGREIALEKDVAEYFEGYNLEATFRGGKPYAIKATDNDGKVAGVAMAVWSDSSGQTYNLVEDNVKTTSNVPFNVMANNNNAEVQSRWMREAANKKATGYGQYGVQAFTSVMENVPEGLSPRVARVFNTAYKAGLTNIDIKRMTFDNDVQRKAFEAGKKDYIMENADKVENVKNVVSRGDKAGFDRTGAPTDTTSEQLDIVDRLCKALGVKGRFVDTLKGNAVLITNQGEMLIARDFERKVKHGDKTRDVSVVYHAAHELAMHRLMELAPVEGQAFINALYRYMEVDGVTGLAEAKRAAYAKQGVDISLSEAMEEVSANAILELYTYDEAKFAKALDRVLNGNDAQAKKGARKFKQILDDIIGKIHKTLDNLGIKKSADLDKLTEIRNLFEKALAKAVEVNEDIAANTTIDENGVVTNSKGEVIAQLNKDGTASFSLKTYDDSGRAELNNWLDDKVKSKALTKAEANDIVEQMEYFYDICKQYEDKYAPFSAWSKAEVVKGLDGKPLMSVVKANGEYKMNLDFSLVCKKRRPLDALYRAMIDDGIMDNIAQLDAVDVARINEIIRSHGLETACTLCFVDAKRYRQFAVADAFVSKYNELVNMLAPEGVKVDRFDFSGKRVASAEGLHTMTDAELKDGINKLNKVLKEHGAKSVVGRIVRHLKAHPNDRKLVSHSDFMDSTGFTRVSQANPKVFKLYNSSKGSGGPKATLPDVQYLGEILKKSNFTPERAYAVGGVRVQSFSDYIPRLVFDYLQMTADLTAKKLPAHAYSKEDIFVMQFGKTGIKINMSLVPAVAKDGVAPGLDKDGNYVWVDGHTFASNFHDKGSGQRGFELAIKIQNTEGYGQNCGTVAVGVSNEHIEKMLKDDNIRMVIPYHKSGLNHLVAQMGNIDQYHDYTNVQNTRYKSGENAGKKITGKDFNFNEAFHRLGDAKAATEEYLAWCEKNDYLPKFDYFAYHEDAAVRENYYKTLIDFAAYDSNGNATPQGAVQMNFPTESDAFGSMKTLIEKGLEADAILEGKKTGKIPEILKEVKAMLGDVARERAEAVELSDVNTKHSLREKEPPKKTGVAYKVFYAKDGQLYPPMVANPNGEGTPVGVWLDADIGKAAPDSKTGRPQVQAGGKGTNASKGSLAFRPGWHLGDIPHATQFARKNPNTGVKDLFPADFVWAECEYAMDVDYQEEAMSYGYTDKGKFRHSYAGLPKLPTDGYYRYRTNPNPDTVPWIITGAMKVNRILTDEETDAICRENGIEPLKRQGGELDLSKLGLKAGGTNATQQKFSLRDSDYMDAVNRGDMETAQKMVDEAAKEAGYNSPRLYHGTQRFGFTRIRTTGVEDGAEWSPFFVTDKLDTAQTYSGATRVREIAEEYNVEDVNSLLSNFVDKVNRTAGVYNFMGYDSHEFDEVIDLIEKGRDSAIIYEKFDEVVDEIAYGLYDKAAYYDESLDEETFFDGDDMVEFYQAASDLLRGLVNVGTMGDKESGNYQIYANTDNLLVLDGGNAFWNDIPLGEVVAKFNDWWVNEEGYEPALNGYYRRANTRSIAKFARYSGYSGVHIKNIYDDGGRSNKSVSESADVYIFFEPQNQIKSADPVTYDDNRNVIPLSKRFDKGNNDIRYSLRDSDGNTLTEAQAEYFKDSKVRDEKGNLLVVYHGSPAKFTVFDHYHINKRGNSHGRGFYFTEKKSLAEGYEQEGGQLLKGYLNITKPLSEDKKTMKKADLLKLIKATCEAEARMIVEDGGYDNVRDALRDTWISNCVNTYEMSMDSAYREVLNIFWNGNDNDVELISDLTNSGAGNKNTLRQVHDVLGYDGVIYTAPDGTHEFVSLVSEQFKNIDNANPTSNVDINYSLRNQNDVSLKDVANIKKAVAKKNADVLLKYVDSGVISTEVYNQLIEEFGAIPKGEKPHRDVSVPQKTDKNKKVSQTVRTILEAKATPDEAVPTIEKMVEDGIFSYDVYTDKQAINDAESYIKEYGWDESLDDWFDAVNKGEVSKEITTMGWALYNNAANIAATTTSETERTSAIKTSLKILDAMVRHQRSAAQALQATRILKKLSPETQLYGIQKSVSALQTELKDKYGDKAPNLEIDEELAEQFINAKTPEERAEVEKEIYKDIGRQMPSRFIDKWNAWRYLAMLGNVRTHIKNIGGNAGFAPIVALKNLTANAIEASVHFVSGKKTIRSKAFVGLGKADRALLKAAWNDYANVADLISNGGKYNDSAMANQYIEEGRQIFKFKPLEWARKGNSKALEYEDMWFSMPHYASALAQYCKANNITAEQLKKGKALGSAREYAIKEAQKATYRDTNAFSQMVSSWGRSNKNEKNVAKKAFNTVVEGILPFRKTPANILVRGIEYSPLGLLKGLSYDLYQVGKGKMTSAEAIDNVSAGLTGTGLLALGVYLAAQGLVRGHGEDDEEKDFKELMGHQSYAFELPNGESVTLDWLAPEALPFFVGVNIYETTKGTDEEVNLSTILQAVSGISEPMLEMSCLQSLNDLFESVGYASSNDTSGLVSVLTSAATSYLTQGLPTLLGQSERTGEENRMTTYTEKNDFLTGDMQYTLGKASAKIPFWDYNQIPYIDAWGRKEASGTALKRGLNNFLNPAYTSTIETSSMERELMRLYERTGESGVFPSRADKYFTVDGNRKDLTAEEYVRYATLKGEKSYKLVSDLVKSKAYKNLSNEEKVKAVKEAYDYANQKAKQAISQYKPESWVSDADKFGKNVGNYLSFKTEVSSTREDNGGKISKQEVVDIALDMAQSDTEIWDMYLSMYDNEKDVYVHNQGVDGEDYMNFILTLDKYDKPTKSGAYGSYTQEEATKAIKNVPGISNRDRAILWKSVNKNWKDKNNPWRNYLP